MTNLEYVVIFILDITYKNSKSRQSTQIPPLLPPWCIRQEIVIRVFFGKI